MRFDEIAESARGLQLTGPVRVRNVSESKTVRVDVVIGESERKQRLDLSIANVYLVVRSRVCKVEELGDHDPLEWTLTENATAGLGSVVARGAYLWVEMALLADHVDAEELALAVEAVGLEADQLEAKTTEGRDRF